MDPVQLDKRSAAAVRNVIAEGESPNTIASYASALRYWTAWYGLRYGQPISLPLPESCVVQFIIDHVGRQTDDGQIVSELPAAIDRALVDNGFKGKTGALALNTVMHRIAVIAKLHVLRGLPNPRVAPAVRELLRMTKRGHAKRGDLPSKRLAVPP